MSVWVLILLGVLNGQPHKTLLVFDNKKTCEAAQTEAIEALTAANYKTIGTSCTEVQLGKSS